MHLQIHQIPIRKCISKPQFGQKCVNVAHFGCDLDASKDISLNA